MHRWVSQKRPWEWERWGPPRPSCWPVWRSRGNGRTEWKPKASPLISPTLLPEPMSRYYYYSLCLFFGPHPLIYFEQSCPSVHWALKFTVEIDRFSSLTFTYKLNSPQNTLLTPFYYKTNVFLSPWVSLSFYFLNIFLFSSTIKVKLYYLVRLSTSRQSGKERIINMIV